MLTCRKCGESFPTCIKIEGKSHNLCKRKYCLKCSPFKLHNTRKVEVERSTRCSICGVHLKHKGSVCQVCNTKVARWRLKLAMVVAKGGQCERCGWSGNPVAFDFHHLDPAQKEIGLNMSTTSQSLLLKEVEKCILLCARCHRLEHAKEIRGEFWEFVFNYRGALEIGELEDWKFLLE